MEPAVASLQQSPCETPLIITEPGSLGSTSVKVEPSCEVEINSKEIQLASPPHSFDSGSDTETEAKDSVVKSLGPVLATPQSTVQETDIAVSTTIKELPLSPKKAKKTQSIRKPKLPKREEDAEAVLDLGCLKTLGTYNKQLLQDSSVCRKDLALLHHVFKHSRRLVVITGAGISVAAGIPDFRSATGLFKLLKNDDRLKASGKQLFDASVVYNDLETTDTFHTTMCDLHKLCAESEPTPFHDCINDISKDKRLLRLYTQNIDCLDARQSHLQTKTPLEAPWPQTVQLHGTINTMNCSKCNWTSPFDPAVFKGTEVVPECPECLEIEGVRIIAGKRSQGVGKLRPKVVLYNEFNPDAEAIGQVTESDLTSKPDGLIVVGTTLKIPGVRRMVREMSQAVHAAKGATVWMNIDDPPQIAKGEFEGCFDLIVKGDCQIIPQVLKDYEQEKVEEEERKIQERKAKAEAKEAAKEIREAAKELKQKQALEKALKKTQTAKVTKKRAPKAARTKSENSSAGKKTKAQARRVKSMCLDTENIGTTKLSEESTSGSSSSDYSTSDSSRDSSPHPEVEVYNCDTVPHQHAYISLSELSGGFEKPLPPKKRTLGVLKKKSVNTTQVRNASQSKITKSG